LAQIQGLYRLKRKRAGEDANTVITSWGPMFDRCLTNRRGVRSTLRAEYSRRRPVPPAPLDSWRMGTNELSGQVAGAITIALIVVLGIFVYPWLIAQRYGPWVVGVMTILLGALFVIFQGSGSSTYSLALAAAWALGPLIAGVIVYRIQRKSG